MQKMDTLPQQSYHEVYHILIFSIPCKVGHKHKASGPKAVTEQQKC